jgi:hypothetical protein
VESQAQRDDSLAQWGEHPIEEREEARRLLVRLGLVVQPPMAEEETVGCRPHGLRNPLELDPVQRDDHPS